MFAILNVISPSVFLLLLFFFNPIHWGCLAFKKIVQDICFHLIAFIDTYTIWHHIMISFSILHAINAK